MHNKEFKRSGKNEGPAHIDISKMFGDAFFKDRSDHIPWTHFFYKIYFNVKRLFCSPKIKKDIDLLQQVENLLSTAPSEPTSDIINKCQHFIQLHRIIENTNARKRLERWATKIIAIYLFVVLIIVILDSLKAVDVLEITDPIMMTILSTTTVNIIGLGLIVLRGHFHEKESIEKNEKEERESKKDTSQHPPAKR